MKGGIKTMLDYWKGKQLDVNSIFVYDGSGLSPRNSISTKTLSQLMQITHSEKQMYNAFFPSLAIAGQTGTLRYMFQKSPAKGNIYAKSGYIDRVLSYTGYVYARSGKKYAFSIIINNFQGKTGPVKRKIEKVLEAIYDS
ncbi:MAG: D-alanyl-D-alanine carboxypeptidase [Bacteroidota bacterium]